MILCVGTLGSGKSALLQALKQYGQECTMATDEYPMDMTKEMEIPYTTPTAGTDILTVSRTLRWPSGNLKPEEKAIIREVGGTMAPIWSSFVESGRISAVLYVVDSSSPETIGTATVHLVELLANPSLDGISVLIVFSKADLQSPRKLQELKSIIRLDQIASMSSQDVQEMTFNIKKKETLGCIFEWCMNFQTSPLDIM